MITSIAKVQTAMHQMQVNGITIERNLTDSIDIEDQSVDSVLYDSNGQYMLALPVTSALSKRL